MEKIRDLNKLLKEYGEQIHERTASHTHHDAAHGASLCARRTWAPQGAPGSVDAMNSEHSPVSAAVAAPRGAAEVGTTTDEFTMRFSSAPRGARLARRLVADRLDVWGHPYTSTANETLTLITAELAADAVTHGRVSGRDFEVRLTADAGTLRVEVSVTCTERLPSASPHGPSLDAESGRGLLVASLADAWSFTPRHDAPGKTVWAEVHRPPVGHTPAPRSPR
ncbi:ATP-binding protein [Streptomyces prasinus]|uniref:ATP-binding protein n=1 Tax=Streptomyces prasinus TaxID=67345 RepID=UPI00363103DD